MSIHITKNRIRATGADANALLISMAPDEQLLKWDKEKFGSDDFQRIVKEAMAKRRLVHPQQ